MRKVSKKIWVWILSGLALIFGGSCKFLDPKESPYGIEEVYGPPPPEVRTDTVDEIVEEPADLEAAEPEPKNDL